MWQELKEHLSCLSAYTCDIWVTLPTGTSSQEHRILSDLPNAHILHVLNRGYDISPFEEVLKRVNLAQYRYCIKLHTKRDMMPPAHIGIVDVSGAKWRNYLLSFMAKDNLARILQAFQYEPALGMVGHHALICKKEPSDSQAWAQSCQWLRIPARPTALPPLKFIAGSMFICRAELLTNFRDTLANVEFEIPSREHPSTLSHAAERFLGHSVTASGFAIRDVYSPGSAKLLFRIKTLSQYALFAIRRFLYQKKSTRKGTTIIKICKIPVFFSHK